MLLLSRNAGNSTISVGETIDPANCFARKQSANGRTCVIERENKNRRDARNKRECNNANRSRKMDCRSRDAYLCHRDTHDASFLLRIIMAHFTHPSSPLPWLSVILRDRLELSEILLLSVWENFDLNCLVVLRGT